MSRRLTREELKKDEVRDTLTRLFLYLESHVKQILAGIAALLLFMLIGTGVFLYREGREVKAQEALAALLPPAPAPDGTVAPESLPNSEVAVRLGELRDDFGGTDAARIGSGYLGAILAADGEIEPAREVWGDYLDPRDSNVLSAAVQINLWEADRRQGKAQDVASELERRLQGDSGLPVDLILYQLAVTYDALNDAAQAEATLERLLDEYPASPWAVEARRRTAAAVAS